MTKQLSVNRVFDGLKPSSTLYINETVNRLWAEGESVYHMGFGESRFDVHPDLQQALKANTHQKSYLPARGLPTLCESVANYYSDQLNCAFDPEQVLIGPGSKALIYGIQMVLAADLFLPAPSWVSYAPQATLLGLKHFYVPSDPKQDYKFDLAAFDKLVSESSNPNKLLVLNSPNNPTGQMLSEQELEEIADYCRSKGIWVLSDEIYFRVSHGGVTHRSIAEIYPEGTFVLGGLSKHLSIGGWRVGVALLPQTEEGKAIMAKMVTLASETWSGVSAPIQYAAIEAYSGNSAIENYVEECSTIHGIRTRFISERLVSMGVRCTRAEGAFYITANFDDFKQPLAKVGVHSSPQLSSHLIDEYRIATLPGGDFGLPSETLSLRLSTSYLDMEDSQGSERLLSLHRQGVSESDFMSVEHHPNTWGALNAFDQFLKDLVS